MVRFSNILIGLLNFLTLIASLPIVIYLLRSRPSLISDASIRVAYLPLLFISLFIMIQSLLGLLGACCRITFFLWVYLFVTFLLILAISAFLIFGFVITNKGIGDTFSDKGVMQYRLGNYSGWLQNHVANADRWKETTTSFKETNICAMSHGTLLSADKFSKTGIAPLKSGCCNPPRSCGFTYVNETYWTIPKSGPSSSEKDCKTWTNDQSKLCFDCDSCKAGMLHYLHDAWKVVSILFGCLLGFLIIVYSIGCCALRNSKDAKYQRYKGAYR